MKGVEGSPDAPPQQPGAPRDFVQSTIDRAVERLYRTIGPEVLSKTPRGLDHIANEQPQPDPPKVPGASRLRFGRRVGATRLLLIFHLCLASLLIAALTGTGIFLLTQPSEKTIVAESAPAEEMPEKASEGTGSITVPAVRPPVTKVVQSAPMAQPAPAAASAQAAPEPEANPPVHPAAPSSGDPAPNTTTTRAEPVTGVASTAVVNALATPSSKPELNTVTSMSGATSTAATPRPSRPPAEWSFSAREIAALVAREDASSATGDVASARLLYEYAASSGEARAAVRLVETFDPVFLGRARLRSVSGDWATALFWYRRARDLGAPEVELRLKTLETKEGG